MSRTVSQPAPDAAQLHAFLAGDPSARSEFPIQASPWIGRLVGHVAPDLVKRGLVEDITQESWAVLSRQTPGAFEAERGQPTKYLRLIVKTGARIVRANNTPPGQRTRLQKDAEGNRLGQRMPDSLDAAGTNGYSLGDLLQDDRSLLDDVDDRVNARQLLALAQRSAPKLVGQALTLIYHEAFSIEQAAKVLGVHRTTLRRAIREWGSQYAA